MAESGIGVVMKTILERKGEIRSRLYKAKQVVQDIEAELTALQKECTHPSEHKEEDGDTHTKCNLCGGWWYSGGW